MFSKAKLSYWKNRQVFYNNMPRAASPAPPISIEHVTCDRERRRGNQITEMQQDRMMLEKKMTIDRRLMNAEYENGQRAKKSLMAFQKRQIREKDVGLRAEAEARMRIPSTSTGLHMPSHGKPQPVLPRGVSLKTSVEQSPKSRREYCYHPDGPKRPFNEKKASSIFTQPPHEFTARAAPLPPPYAMHNRDYSSVRTTGRRAVSPSPTREKPTRRSKSLDYSHHKMIPITETLQRKAARLTQQEQQRSLERQRIERDVKDMHNNERRRQWSERQRQFSQRRELDVQVKEKAARNERNRMETTRINAMAVAYGTPCDEQVRRSDGWEHSPPRPSGRGMWRNEGDVVQNLHREYLNGRSISRSRSVDYTPQQYSSHRTRSGSVCSNASNQSRSTSHSIAYANTRPW